jgi:hypothetical protein
MNPVGPDLGVMRAVSNFCRDYRFELVLLTNDLPPKYLLARDYCQARRLLNRVLEEARFVIELDPMSMRHTIVRTENRKRVVMRLASRTPLQTKVLQWGRMMRRKATVSKGGFASMKRTLVRAAISRLKLCGHASHSAEISMNRRSQARKPPS